MHYSLFVGLLGVLITPGVDAAVRVGNKSRTYAESYNQVNAQRAQVEYEAQAAAQAAAAIEQGDFDLPVRVADANLAKQIARGDTTAKIGVSQLESCSKIYPEGEFAWDTPTIGTGAGGASTCVAVVEMRGVQMGVGGSDVVLARANLAAGDAVKCNISEFPESSYTIDAGNITFPADAEPTTDDVIRVMNEEQKKNAGLKIAAATLVGGIGGNISGKNEPGQDGLLGTGKHKMQNTIIGALGGAAIGAGSVYAGKVGGDIILSTGVNAAAGGLIGNMAASGDSVLRIEDCTTPEPENAKTKCLWGMLVTSTPLKLAEGQTDKNGNTIAGDVKKAYFNINDETTVVCNSDDTNCQEEDLISITLSAYPDKTLESVKEADFQAIKTNNNSSLAFHLETDSVTGQKKMVAGAGSSENATYTPISAAGKPDKQIAAMIPGVQSLDKAFGAKRTDWAKWRNSHMHATILGRTAKGESFTLENIANYDLQDFYPMYVDAEDGGIIDLGNKARLKGTLIGAGTGGALGAFVAYQGAQTDIDNRWVSAVREYKDSLQKVYCVTGNRFLSFYNDYATIPQMGE